MYPRRHRGRGATGELDAGAGGRQRPRGDLRTRPRSPTSATSSPAPPVPRCRSPTRRGMLQVSPASSAEDLVAPFVGSDELPDVQAESGRSFGRVIPATPRRGALALHGSVGSGLAGWRPAVTAVSYARPSSRRSRTRSPAPSSPERTRGWCSTGASRMLSPPVLARRSAADGHATPRSMRRSDPERSPPRPALDPSQLPRGRPRVRRATSRPSTDGRRAATPPTATRRWRCPRLDRSRRRPDGPRLGHRAFFETPERDSVLGSYSIDEVGQTTLGRISGYELGRGPT